MDISQGSVKKIAASFLRFTLGIASLITCTYISFAFGVLNSGMSSVILAAPSGVSRGIAPSTQWLMYIAVFALGLAIAPVRRENSFAFLWFRPWLSVWLLFVWFAGARIGAAFEFVEPSDQCVYANCWPLGFQDILSGLPLLIACVIALLTDIFRRPSNGFVRAVLPSAVYLTLTAVQFLVWDSYVLPFLSGPPIY